MSVLNIVAFAWFQEERGISEQEATGGRGGGGGGSARPARGPGQPGGQTLSPIASPPKNPQPTMGVKRKNDSKLPPEDAVRKLDSPRGGLDRL